MATSFSVPGAVRLSRPSTAARAASNSARCASVKNSWDAYLAGRCSGVSFSSVQMPCRSGSPQGVCNGAVCNGAVCNGAVCNGAVCNGAVCNGAVCNGAVCNGAVCNGAVCNGCVFSDGTGAVTEGACACADVRVTVPELTAAVAEMANVMIVTENLSYTMASFCLAFCRGYTDWARSESAGITGRSAN